MSLLKMIKFINILKVGYKCRKKIINVKKQFLSISLLLFLYRKGIIEGWYFNEFNKIEIKLRYIKNKPIFNNLKIISTPGYRRFISKKKNIKYFKDNVDIILSTSRGLLTLKEASNLGIGGEIFFIIYY